MNPDFPGTEPMITDPELEAAVCTCLRQLIATLKPDDAAMIERTDLNKEPGEAVAASMGISMANLGIRMRRTRQVLKQRLVEMCLTCPEHGIMDCDCETARRAELLRAAALEKG